MFDKTVGNPEPKHGARFAFFLFQKFQYAASESSRQHVLFDGDDLEIPLGQGKDQVPSSGLQKRISATSGMNALRSRNGKAFRTSSRIVP